MTLSALVVPLSGTALAAPGITLTPAVDYQIPGTCNKFTATVEDESGPAQNAIVAIDIKQTDGDELQDLVVSFCDPDGAGGAATDAGGSSDLDDNVTPDDGFVPVPVPLAGTENPGQANGTCTTNANGRCSFGVNSNEVGRMDVNVVTDNPADPTTPFFDQSVKRWTRNLPACSDGNDNDGDGKTDLNDPGCRGPGDDTEGAGRKVRSGPCKGFRVDSRTKRNGGGRVIVGSGSGDVLEGSGGPDIICGLDGKDTIAGKAGDDLVVGNGKDDTIDGGTGADSLRGDDGNDVFSGGGGKDKITGGSGSDSVDGNKKNDVIVGGRGNDTLRGNRGWDTIRGRKGSDILQGGTGNDTLRGGGGGDSLKGFSGRDDLNGGDGRDRCRGGGGRDSQRSCER